jgi:hypothetical protein
MLYREGDFEEWKLAEAAQKYIPDYLKNEDDTVCYVPYKDVPTRTVKYIKFALLNGQWVYVDNSQGS